METQCKEQIQSVVVQLGGLVLESVQYVDQVIWNAL